MERAKLHPDLQISEFSLDNILISLANIPKIELAEIDLSTMLTPNIRLKRPLVSSPMDTVTGREMAILMALSGGIGVIHFGFPTIEEQMAEVKAVRSYEAAFVRNPVVLGVNSSIGDVFKEADRCGFYTFPITEDGTLQTKLLGLVTRRDVRYREDFEQSVAEIMTPFNRLCTAPSETTLDINDIKTANGIIRQHNLDTLPIIDREGKIVALVTDSDLQKDKRYPLATKDANKQLKVLVAIESRLNQRCRDRIAEAARLGVSGVVVDARNIWEDHIEIAKYVTSSHPEMEVILGNVVSPEVIRDAMERVGYAIGAFRVGIGTGEVCTSQEELGIGSAMGSALRDVVAGSDEYRGQFNHIGIIGDGGFKKAHHIGKALALGADVVMMGSALAGLDESPGEAYWDDEECRMVKKVRGMGSPQAIKDRAGGSRYGVERVALEERYPEGIEKKVAYRGSGEEFLKKLFNGVRMIFQAVGAHNIEELRQKAYIKPAVPAASKGTL